ncbi:fumarylacetoacetate hydrolase family protein [Psychromarinibacter halotolerans]|uniref:Fumarylacetoacetate hydrolase family protein n=1 Tax=Psychromarinibacter halotolerans TaxID=1775175 RepID=A0ABV7GP85_9RHOB|nr:fumarylacetoacetate hydrolase family protein [Psychromarinibacter halotolerans]MAQ82159.1 fumarylacetoacetate hydrolase [Maritimibacter sp.]MDF0595742.1 fumarylacetoacetate hydrolase family protein [Psychromarinibacter halotolerans]
MAFVFDPAPTPSAAVAGTDDRFPVRRIFCVGRNYAEHAREMGNDPDREPPFFFTKAPDSVVEDGATVPYPPETEDLHFEGEFIVAIGKAGFNVSEADALDYVWGYGTGNDLTRRDLQWAAKKAGRPWDWSKGFDRAAVIGALYPATEVGHPSKGFIRTEVNGEIRQDADLSDMIWAVPEIIAYLTRSIEIRPGDLIMTGTPAGVGALQVGDSCTVSIEGLGAVTTKIGPKA